MTEKGKKKADTDGANAADDPTKEEELYLPVSELAVSEKIRNFYLDSGIQSLYPPQSQAVLAGLLDNKNVMISIPTASGKTLLAELAMLKSIENGGKALYTVPLRALASEKFRRFSSFSKMDVSAGISTGDLDSADEYLGSNDIIVATSEKVDSLIRNETRWLQHISVVILDEVHLIDSPDRGPTLEIIITKLRRINPEMQIIALSATIQNSGEVAEWLNASHVVSSWRPTKLYEGVYFDGVYKAKVQKPSLNAKNNLKSSKYSKNSKTSKTEKKSVDADKGETEIKIDLPEDPDSCIEKEIKQIYIGKLPEAAVSLVADVISDSGQCLVFESSRKNAVGFAKKAAPVVSSLLKPSEKDELAEIAAGITEGSDTDIAVVLANCILHGTAFHHAGLTAEQRETVETSFLAGKIKMISSTPTLAAGLNLPARRVIIRSWRRYDSDSGMQPIPVMEYKQMAGRAGRPHLDPYGESVLIASKEDDVDMLTERFIEAPPENIESKLGAENMVRTHVLSTIANGFADTREKLLEFFKGTFFAHQRGLMSTIALSTLIDKCLDFLIENEMSQEKRKNADAVSEALDSGPASSPFQTADKISKSYTNFNGRSDAVLIPTTLGSLVSKLYIDPLSATTLLDGVLKSKEGGGDPAVIGFLHLICQTPDMKLLYMRSSDYEWVQEFIADNIEHFISVPETTKPAEYEWFMGEVKTAVLLYRWISETPENDISKEFDVGEGDIRNFSETAGWMANAASRLCQLCGFKSEAAALSDLELRLQYGASVDLLSLLKIRGIGRVRARKLYNAGFKSKDMLKKSDYVTVAGLVGPKIAEQIYKETGMAIDPEDLKNQKKRKERLKSPQSVGLSAKIIDVDAGETVSAPAGVNSETNGDPAASKPKKTQRRFDEFFND
ncbi:hypothetical protein MsAg5_04910 [Methanosarcinaceae archaeon Ag5]|uniref:ATP-dependent DNA helicase Hel308 n=1 Tax=Methanolapillus africanus TaxID=3028297 RepID=A0AAE4MJ85_9EURY|nr:hypothetical protein [Methanosarcinaceae archaeon Ag5]